MASRRLNYLIGFNADISQAQQSIQTLINLLLRLGTTSGLGLSQLIREASLAAVELGANLKNATDWNTGKIDLMAFSNNLRRSGRTLTDYGMSMRDLGAEGEAAFFKVALQITSAELPLKRTNKLMDSLWVTMKNTMRWQLTTSMLRGFLGSISSAYGYAKDLNESLNRILIVTGKSTELMAAFALQANEAAKALSTTTTKYTDASLIYAQLGLDDELIKERTEATIRYANVANISTKEASELLTSVWNNFADGSKSLEYYIDVMTKLGATTASSSQEISTGVQKFSAVASTIGLSYEYAAAALATVTANTRESADVVGNAFKTLFSRILGLKLGDTLEDGTDLNKYSKALLAVGINIKDVNGEIKNMDIILDELGGKWETLTKDLLIALAQTVAGVRLYTQLVALMDSWPDFQKNLTMAYGSTGELDRQAEVYAQSWEAARDRVKASTEDVYDSLVNSDFWIGLDNAIGPFLSGIAKMIDNMDGLSGVIKNVISLVVMLYSDKIALGMRNFVANIGISTGYYKEYLRLLLQEAATQAHNTITSDRNTLAQQALNLLVGEGLLLKQRMNQESDRMTSAQRELLNYDRQIVDSLEKELELLALQSQEREKLYNLLKNALLTSIPHRGILERNAQLLLQVRDGAIRADTTEMSTLLRSGLGGGAYENINSIITAIDQLTTRESKLNSFLGALLRMGEGATITAEEVRLLATRLNILDLTLIDNITNTDSYTGKLNQIRYLLRGINNDIELGRNILVQFGNGGAGINRTINSLIDNLRQFKMSEVEISGVIDLVTAAIARLNGYLDSGRYKVVDWAAALTRASSIIGTLVMAMNGLLSLGRVFTDEDMSTGQKIFLILMSLSLILPAISTAYLMLTKAKSADSIVTTVSNALTTKLMTAEGLGIVTKLAMWRATRMVTKARIQDTAVLEASTKAQIANAAATLAGLIALGSIVAIISVVTIGLAVLSKTINDNTFTLEEAKELSESTSKAYEEMKSSYDALKSSLEDYEEAREGINNLTEGTEEFKNAIEEANKKALELISNYKDLAQYANYNAGTGLIEFDELGAEKVRQAQEDAVQKGYSALILALQAVNDTLISTLRKEILDSMQTITNLTEFNNKEMLDELINFIESRGGVIDDRAVDEAKGGQSPFYFPDLAGAVLSDSGIVEQINDLIKLVKTNDESSKFLIQEANKSILQSSNDIFAGLSETTQNAVANMIQNSSLYQEAVNAELAEVQGTDMDDQAKKYAGELGYDTENIDISGKMATFYDKNTGEVIAENISLDLILQTIAKINALLGDVADALVDTFSAGLNRVSQVVSNFNIDELEGLIQDFAANAELSFEEISLLDPFDVTSLNQNLKNFLSTIDDVDWASLGYNDGAEFALAFLDSVNAKWSEDAWINNFSTVLLSARNAAVSALETIQEEEVLDDTTVANLNSKFKGIFEFDEDFINESVYELTEELYEALLSTIDAEGILNKRTEELTDSYNDLQDRINSNAKELTKLNDEMKSQSGKAKDATREQIDELENMNQSLIKARDNVKSLADSLEDIKIEPIKIDIELEDLMIDAALAKLDVFLQAAGYIEEGYTVAAENVEELARLMPQLFELASVDTLTGIVLLNLMIVDSYALTADQMLVNLNETLQKALNRRVTESLAELAAVQALKAAIKVANDDELANVIQNSAILEDAIKEAAYSILLDKVLKEKSIRDGNDTTTGRVVDNQKQITQASAKEGKATASNWALANNAIMRNWYLTASYNVSIQKAISTHTAPPLAPVLSGSGSYTSSGGSSFQLSSYTADSGNEAIAWLENKGDLIGAMKQEKGDKEFTLVQVDEFAVKVYELLEEHGIDVTLHDAYQGFSREDLSALIAGQGRAYVDKWSDLLSEDALNKLATSLSDMAKSFASKNALTNSGTGTSSGGSESKKTGDSDLSEKKSYVNRNNKLEEIDRKIQYEQELRKIFELSEPYPSAKTLEEATEKTEEQRRNTLYKADSLEREKILLTARRDELLINRDLDEKNLENLLAFFKEEYGYYGPETLETNEHGELLNLADLRQKLDDLKNIWVYTFNEEVGPNTAFDEFDEYYKLANELLDKYLSDQDALNENDLKLLLITEQDIPAAEKEWREAWVVPGTLEAIQDLATIEDRYKAITQEMERLQDILDDLDHLTDRAYGIDKINAFTQKLIELDEQIEKGYRKLSEVNDNRLADTAKLHLYMTKEYIANNDAVELMDKLYEKVDELKEMSQNEEWPTEIRKMFLENVEVLYDLIAVLKERGYKIDLGTDGEILNLEEIQQLIEKTYETSRASYDKFMEEYNAATSLHGGAYMLELMSEQKELQELFFLNAETLYLNDKKMVDLVLTDLEQAEEVREELEENLRAEADNRLLKIIYELDVVILVNDMKKAVNDFAKAISESFGDAITHGVRAMDFSASNASIEASLLEDYRKLYNALAQELANSNMYTDTQAIVDEMENLQGKIIESGEYLLDWIDSLEHLLPDAIDAAADRFAIFTEQLEHNDTVLSTIEELMALQGVSYKTQEGYEKLQNVSRERMEAQVALALLLREWFEGARRELLEAEEALAGVEETDVAFDTLKANRDALLEEYNAAQEAMLLSAQEAMETARQMYLRSVDKAMYDFSKNVTGGVGLDLLQEKFDHYIELSERYLDTANELYLVNMWNLKLDKAINDAATTAQKERLKKLKEEIDIRRRAGKLSLYDLDMLEAKYKIITATNELEDAQNAKNQLQLVRDSLGNWNYLYSANQEEVSDAKGDLFTAEIDRYNLAKDLYTEILKLMLDATAEYALKREEILKTNFENEEDRLLALAELDKYYNDLMIYLGEEKNISLYDLNEAGMESLLVMHSLGTSKLVDEAGNTYSALLTISDEAKAIIKLIEDESGAHLSEFTQRLIGILEEYGLSADLIINGIKVDENGKITGLSNDVLKALEDLGINAEDILKGLETDLAGPYQRLWEKNYGVTEAETSKMWQSVVGNLGLMANKGLPIVEGLTGTSQEEFEGMRDNGLDTIGGLSDGMLDLLGDLGDGIDDKSNMWNDDYLESLEDMSVGTEDFTNYTGDMLDQTADDWEEYKDDIEDIADDTGTNLDDLTDVIDTVAETTDECREVGVDCAESLWDTISEIQDVSLSYLELADSIMQVINAMDLLSMLSFETVEEYEQTPQFDNSIDYSALMAGYVSKHGIAGMHDETFKILSEQRNAKIDQMKLSGNSNYDTYGKERYGEEFIDWLAEIADPDSEGNAHEEWYLPSSQRYMDEFEETLKKVLKLNVPSFDTGGYTGTFQDEKLAFLHQKELVLNEDDTRNILSSAMVLRDVGPQFFSTLEKMIDNNVLAGFGLMASKMNNTGSFNFDSSPIEQLVHIEASFPNVTNSSEIEDALATLVNDAAQWSRIRR